MHPDFEHYRKKERGTPTKATTSRLPEDLVTTLELIGRLEDDSISGLLLEGAARVIEDRLQNGGLANTTRAISERRQAEDATLLELNARAEQLFGDSKA